MRTSETRFLKAVGVVLLLTGLSGCQDYLTRSETVLPGVGNAIALHRTTHTVDPWPPTAHDAVKPTDGAVVDGAVERYRTGNVKRPTAQSSSNIVRAAP